MKLRQWQLDCAQAAIKHYSRGDKSFMCLATPGAGKTIMAAEITSRLFKKRKIDFVLCFSPSVSVSRGISNAFSNYLDARFDGVIGAVGCSFTYQNLLFLNKDFWRILQSNRVMVIFDEIHHCAGLTKEYANAWGMEILNNIENQAEYTLTLTGTPWRSDRLPITLSKYEQASNRAVCDYIYGLKDAVLDGVCRSPKIVLIDNEKLTISNEQPEQKTYSSFGQLLNEASVSYSSVINNAEAMKYILSQGCKKLEEKRSIEPNAAGLVVASSVNHAFKIRNMLVETFHQSAVIATYKQNDAATTIEEFKSNNIQWIVSVGMVSEGTDIPRLQVCCHLSRIKTELYFRQVLGRVLRVTNAERQDAWLFVFAEPELSKYAYRIAQELPDEKVILDKVLEPLEVNKTCHNEMKQVQKDISMGLSSFKNTSSCSDSEDSFSSISELVEENMLSIHGKFRDKVIAAFENQF